MRRLVITIGILMPSLGGPVAAARADMRVIPPLTGSDKGDIAVVIGGLALSLAVILFGLWLLRRRPRYLLLVGVVVIVTGVVLRYLFHLGAFITTGGLLIGLTGLCLMSLSRRGDRRSRESIEEKGPDD